jgi:hypothetical protein
MIYVHNIVEFDYDELERNDIYLYEVPDDFVFDSSLVVKFLESKGVKAKINRELPWVVNICSAKGNSLAGNFTIEWMMRNDTSSRRDGIEKGDFLKWLETQGVKKLEYKMIE